MRSAATTLLIEADLKARAEAMARRQGCSVDHLLQEALAVYLDHVETELAEIDAAMASFEHFQDTGLHITLDEAAAWLDTWGTDQEQEAPRCHG